MHSHDDSSNSGGSIAGSPSLVPGEERLMVSDSINKYKLNDISLNNNLRLGRRSRSPAHQSQRGQMHSNLIEKIAVLRRREQE